jgi:uncharacterized protein YndB with AHSA1/START domain
MSVTSVDKDLQQLTMTVTCDFAAPVDVVWQLWADPRKLERWWGPPSFPATVEEHDFRAGGRVTYYMTGPGGEKPRGWWDITALEPPHTLEMTDGFADDDGNPNPEMPTMRMRVTLTEGAAPGATVMVIRTEFPSADAMERLLAMGMEQGITEALSQADALLESTPAR